MSILFDAIWCNGSEPSGVSGVMAMKATTVRAPFRRSALAALIVFAVLLSACTQTASPDGKPDAAVTSPGRADDFSWYWETVSAVPGEPGSYSIQVRFTNMSEGASPIPDCWAVAGPGHAGSMRWEQRPVVQAGDTNWASGIATFARPILEIDEVVCDPEVAASYRP